METSKEIGMETDMDLSNRILFAKVKSSAIIPSKRDEDAGLDLYACFDELFMVIMPHATRNIPLGIASAFSKDYSIEFKERGSTGVLGIAQRSGVIDSGYRGEWGCPVTNTSNKLLVISKLTAENLSACLGIKEEDMIVYPYKKAICQGMVRKVEDVETGEVSYSFLANIESERGTGAYGSTGK